MLPSMGLCQKRCIALSPSDLSTLLFLDMSTGCTSLYSLKQAPRAWYSRFASHHLSLGLTKVKSNTSLFIYRRSTKAIYLLLYVDNILLTASSQQLHRVIAALKNEFAMKDLGPLHHFLGVAVQRHKDTLFHSQQQYILDMLAQHGMSDCKPCSASVDTCAKVPADPGPSVQPCGRPLIFDIHRARHCICR